MCKLSLYIEIKDIFKIRDSYVTNVYFFVTIIIIHYSHSIFILDVNASSKNSLINNLLNTVNNTLNTITGSISDLPKYFEYTIDIDPKEVFPNQTIKKRILNEFEPIKYFIPK
jgi:hypothetical protein